MKLLVFNPEHDYALADNHLQSRNNVSAAHIGAYRIRPKRRACARD